MRHAKIRPYLPDTALCTSASLRSYLHRYPAVYIKPDGGGRGEGVVKAWRNGQTYHYVKVRGKTRTADSIASMSRRLGLKKRYHIVQRAIDLASVNGRPFDIRLMMMKDTRGKWTAVGMTAKVAGTSSIITNVARGKGYVLPVETALRRALGLTSDQIAAKKREMIRLASMCTPVYCRTRNEWQIGYDLAVDRRGKVWFIEMNPRVPAHSLFRKQPKVYRRIKQLAAFHRKR
jgi:hypothetical protein